MTVVGESLGEHVLPVTREDLRRYADASGDHNPIHLDDDAARALGLPGIVAHGMLTLALAIGIVARWAGGADRVRATRVRFTTPVEVPPEGAELLVSGTVKHIDPAAGTAEIALTASSGGRRVFGRAVVTVALDEVALDEVAVPDEAAALDENVARS